MQTIFIKSEADIKHANVGSSFANKVRLINFHNTLNNLYLKMSLVESFIFMRCVYKRSRSIFECTHTSLEKFRDQNEVDCCF